MSGDASPHQEVAPVRLTVALAAATFVAGWVFAVLLLRFDMFVSDIKWYWDDSTAWRVPFSTVHVPLYALLVAALRGLTANALPALVYMWTVAFAAHLAGVWAFTRWATRTAGREAGLWGSLLFAFWPLVGTSYAVYPTADPLTIALFVLALDALCEERFHRAGLALGFALLANKAIWPVSFLLVLAAVWTYRGKLRRRFGAAVLLVLPLLAYWIAGTSYFDSVSWPFSRYIRYGESRTSVPVLDGLFGHFVAGGASDVAKGAVVWATLLAALALGLSLRRCSARPERLYALMIVVATVLGLVMLNHDAVWAAVRYSRLLAVPLVLCFPFAEAPWIGASRRRTSYALVAVALFATQLVFLYYISEVYFAKR